MRLGLVDLDDGSASRRALDSFGALDRGPRFVALQVSVPVVVEPGRAVS